MSASERSFRVSNRLTLLVRPTASGTISRLEFTLMDSEANKKSSFATQLTDFGKVYSNLLIVSYRDGITLDNAEKISLRNIIQEALTHYVE